MNTSTLELLKSYKTPYTPMDWGSSTLPIYIDSFSSTGSWAISTSISQHPKVTELDIAFPTLEKFKDEKVSRILIDTFSKFTDIWEKKKLIFQDFPKSFVFDKTKLVIEGIAALNPSYIILDFTDDQSIFFKIGINNLNIYFELYFIDEQKIDVEAILNIYRNGEPVFAFGGQPELVISKIETKISENQIVFSSTNSQYGLSESSFAPAYFQENYL